VGYQALYASNGASSPTAIGYQALKNSTGDYNTAVGSGSLYTNTTASYNTALGYQAGYTNSTGNFNIFLGYQAGYSTTSAGNVFIGVQAGQNTTGAGNTFIGGFGGTAGSGSLVTTGANNTILGAYDGNQGSLDIRTASNYIVLSDGSGAPRAYQSSTGGWYQYNNLTVWSITSDIRIKKNIVSLESGLSVIKALRPVEFDYIENDKHDIGFIAQEYQTVLPEQVNEKDDGMLSLNQNLVPYLVKAIQELSAEIQSLKAKLGT
jgi:hypothetical protein